MTFVILVEFLGVTVCEKLLLDFGREEDHIMNSHNVICDIAGDITGALPERKEKQERT